MNTAPTLSVTALEGDGTPPQPLVRDVAKSRFLSNVISNIAYVVLNSAIMLWYVPYLVRHLGVAAYGMISLSVSLVMYASIISASLDTSIGRFLAIDLNRGEAVQANQTFNTSLALSFLACGLLLVPGSVVAFMMPALFHVPPDLELASQFLFVAVCINAMIAIIGGNFGVASLITHRFDLRNIVRSVVSLTRVAVVVLCFTIAPASLWFVALGFVVAAFANLAGDILLWRRLTPQLHVRPSDVDRHRFRALFSLSGWTSVNQVGYLLLMQVDLLVVNAIFGAEMTGRYGLIMLFPGLIFMVTETVIGVLSPVIMARYALGDMAGVSRISQRAVKLLGIGLALPIGLLCGFSGPILSLWLGPDFVDLDILLVLLVGHLVVNLASRPLSYVVTAYNRVRIQGVVTLCLGIANVALATALALWSGWGAIGVAAAAATLWTLRNVIFLSSYSAKLMHLPWWTFYRPLIAGAVSGLAIVTMGRVATQFWWPQSWLHLGLMAAVVSLIYAGLTFFVSLSRSDRAFVLSLLHRKRPA